jgi:uncharacterized protein (TIGR02646 family)
MHELQRGVAPACLAKFQHVRDNWNGVTSLDKLEIWKELDAMQGERCAYCEAAIKNGNRHIEHFRQKGRDPTATFLWPNLFGSCNREDSCGKHKDRCGTYPPADLIKPDVEDPERFLVFAPDGSVSSRKRLSPDDHRRAEATIRIFNLGGPLNQIRRTEVAGYIQTAEAFAEMAQAFAEEEWLPLLQEEVRNTAHLPFATAIKHVLTRQSSHP